LDYWRYYVTPVRQIVRWRVRAERGWWRVTSGRMHCERRQHRSDPAHTIFPSRLAPDISRYHSLTRTALDQFKDKKKRKKKKKIK
jgi:hypothetical protein